jgi:hypothetical protein
MKKKNTNIWHSYKLLLAAVLLFCVSFSYAQPDLPPRSITVIATQAIQFGTLCVGGAGGTVTVGWDGSRSFTGDVVLLSMSPYAQPAIFEIKLCQGRNANIIFDPETDLSNGSGGLITLHIGPTEKGNSGETFAVNNDCNFITLLRVGGTLEVPGSAQPGTYTGGFSITFNYE